MQHYNPSISEEMHRIFNLKSGDINNKVVEEITAIKELMPLGGDIGANALLSNATTTTLYTTPSDKDVYIQSAQLSYVSDATATTTFIGIRGVINGVNKYLILLPRLTLTATNATEVITFKYPIKFDRGTNIVILSDTNVANFRASGTIHGYTIETIKGV